MRCHIPGSRPPHVLTLLSVSPAVAHSPNCANQSGNKASHLDTALLSTPNYQFRAPMSSTFSPPRPFLFSPCSPSIFAILPRVMSHVNQIPLHFTRLSTTFGVSLEPSARRIYQLLPSSQHPIKPCHQSCRPSRSRAVAPPWHTWGVPHSRTIYPRSARPRPDVERTQTYTPAM